MKLLLLAVRERMNQFHLYRSVVGLISVAAIVIATTAMMTAFGPLDVHAALKTSIIGALGFVFAFLGLDMILMALPSASEEELKAAYNDVARNRFVRRYAALTLAKAAKQRGADAWEVKWRERAEAV
jgi:cadmium resistance protein CadD (predicted permease)